MLFRVDVGVASLVASRGEEEDGGGVFWSCNCCNSCCNDCALLSASISLDWTCSNSLRNLIISCVLVSCLKENINLIWHMQSKSCIKAENLDYEHAILNYFQLHLRL